MWLLLLLLLDHSGCLSLDYGDEPFTCKRSGICPEGFVCVAGVCRRPPALADISRGEGWDAGARPDGSSRREGLGDRTLQDRELHVEGSAWDLKITRQSIALKQGGPIPGGTYQGVTDTYINLAHPDQAYGNEVLLMIDSVDDEKHLLIRFDLGPIPAGALIDRATLKLWRLGGSASGGMAGAFRLLRPWGNQATWNSTGVAAWSTPGGTGAGDIASTLSASAAIPPIGGVLELDLTGLVALWHASPSTNHGVLLMETGTPSQTYSSYRSSEGTGSLVPTLTVDCVTFN